MEIEVFLVCYVFTPSFTSNATRAFCHAVLIVCIKCRSTMTEVELYSSSLLSLTLPPTVPSLRSANNHRFRHALFPSGTLFFTFFVPLSESSK